MRAERSRRRDREAPRIPDIAEHPGGSAIAGIPGRMRSDSRAPRQEGRPSECAERPGFRRWTPQECFLSWSCQILKERGDHRPEEHGRHTQATKPPSQRARQPSERRHGCDAAFEEVESDDQRHCCRSTEPQRAEEGFQSASELKSGHQIRDCSVETNRRQCAVVESGDQRRETEDLQPATASFVQVHADGAPVKRDRRECAALRATSGR